MDNQYIFDQYKKLLEQSQTKTQSLSDRLNEMDKYNGSVTPSITKSMTDFSNRPAGYNPLKDVSSAIEMITGANTARKGAEQDYSTSLASQYKALDQLQTALQSQEDRKLKERQVSADEASKGLKFNPTTGKIEVSGSGLSGDQAVAEVIKQGGAELLNQAKDMNARSALAETIIKSGGVSQYRKLLPLDSLLSEKERDTLNQKSDLDILIEQAKPLFKKDVLGGTGPIAGKVPDWAVSSDTREKRRTVENIRSQYQKMISGAAVSEQEAERLKKFLPSVDKTETQNYEDLAKLSRDLNINMEIYEIGKREGLTASQAFKKYRKEVFAKYGLDEKGQNVEVNNLLDKYLKK